MRRCPSILLVLCSLLVPLSAVHAQFAQQGHKLIGTGATGRARQGYAVAISADGHTAVVGGPVDAAGVLSGGTGAIWVYTRSNGVWIQQGEKLVGTAGADSGQGYSVAISGDGNTIVAGAPYVGGGVWVFTRSGGVWAQQGAKLVGVGAVQFGHSVAVSSDGNTLVASGYFDNSLTAGSWVFVRTEGVWEQQGPMLVGSNIEGANTGRGAVALSGDGETFALGRAGDARVGNQAVGAVWVFRRQVDHWSQQGPKLVGTGAVGEAQQGGSVALSHDGSTLASGGNVDVNLFTTFVGATWIFTRDALGFWTQQGDKLVGTGVESNGAAQGTAVSLSADGNLLVASGVYDAEKRGALWLFIRTGTQWAQLGTKLIGYLSGGGPVGSGLGRSAAISSDKTTIIAGGPEDGDGIGAAWIFTAATAIGAHTGAGQTTQTGSSFAPLSARVIDADGDPVSNILVVFASSPGPDGANGQFESYDPVLTDANGIAGSSTLTANYTAGTFTVTATAQGLPTPATFHLTSSSNPVPPSNVVATATSSTSVSITWTAQSGATMYEVLRASSASAYDSLGTTSAASFQDMTAAGGTAYLYKVRVTLPTPSPDSASDLATTVIFTDSVLTAQPVRAVHVTELRSAIDAARALSGLGPFAFADAPLAAAVTKIRATHVTEMREALNAARSALALSPIVPARPTLAGSLLAAVDLVELRVGVQ